MPRGEIRQFIDQLVTLPQELLSMYKELTDELTGGQDPEGLAKRLRQMLDAHASACKYEREREHVIDTDLDPKMNKDIKEHRKLGRIVCSPVNFQLIICDEQMGRVGTTGHHVWKVLHEKKVCNATVLEYLLERPWLIPEDWEGKQIFFWGTHYKTPFFSAISMIRGMEKKDGRWSEINRAMDKKFNENCAALVFT